MIKYPVHLFFPSQIKINTNGDFNLGHVTIQSQKLIDSYLNICLSLIKNGASLNERLSNGDNPFILELMIPLQFKTNSLTLNEELFIELFNLILEKGINVNETTYDGYNGIHIVLDNLINDFGSNTNFGF